MDMEKYKRIEKLTVKSFRTLENELRVRVNDSNKELVSQLKKVVNPKSCAKVPVHNWYYLKESYSPALIKKLIESEIIRKPEKRLLDPFMGAGSSLLGAQWLGIPSIGVDINPFFCFVVKTKTKWHEYDLKEIKNFVEEIKKLDTLKKAEIDPPELSTFKRIYDNETLNELLRIKELILSEAERKGAEFDFKACEWRGDIHFNLYWLAFASILEDSSLAKKDGKGLKIVRKEPKGRPKELFMSKLKQMYHDIKTIKSQLYPHRKAEVEVINGDTRKLKEIPDNYVNAIVFSPPYCNTFDYTEVYKVELWMLDFVKNYEEFRKLRNRTLRSHNLFNSDEIKRWKQEKDGKWRSGVLEEIIEFLRTERLWSPIIPDMAQAYFDDMYIATKNFFRIMEEGDVAIVVGNSAYAGVVIPTDLLLMKMAQELGFKPKAIYFVRRLGTSSQQLKILKEAHIRDLLRETIVVYSKE